MEGLESFFTSGQQMNLFLISCIFGIPIGVLYDVFRTIRIIFRHNKIAVMAEDILFFAIYAVFTMCFTITAARSEFRFYYCLGNLLGFILYYITVGKAVVMFFKKTVGLLKKIIRKPMHKFALICVKFASEFVGILKNKKTGKKL